MRENKTTVIGRIVRFKKIEGRTHQERRIFVYNSKKEIKENL